ncbi:MAG: alpha/beta hydrolase [Candidatus Bathyarchaeia archaeon]
MALHPQAEAFLKRMMLEHVPTVSTLSPIEARRWDAKVTGFFTSTSEEVARVENFTVPGPGGPIPVRVYTPIGDMSNLLMYFHGGGWVLGNLDLVDLPCRLLANRTGRVVVSVDYRLAPEYKFPAAAEDCYAATKWVAENGDKFMAKEKAIAVCGDSAGGNLAAVVSLMARDHGVPTIEDQILIYPITDLSDSNYKSFPDEQSPGLTRNDMQWFIDHYITKPDDVKNAYASPIDASDLSKLPSALVITAEYDILLKQCNSYSEKLRKAGVLTTSKNYQGAIHGFFTLPNAFDAARDAVAKIAETLSTNKGQGLF